MTEKYDNLRRLHDALSGLDYCLAVFGDHIAKREGYKGNDGIEAVQFYLIHKHNWLPRDVRSMSFEEMRFALSEELAGWTLPKAAQPPKD
ncbi:MAG: hypothetical protein ACREVW_01000 [Burkholderiales bacterium]